MRDFLNRLGMIQGGFVIGNLFYGSNGWMALNSVGYHVYRGPRSLKIMDGKPAMTNDGFESGNTILHMENFLAAVRSRNYKDLNADISTGVPSANLVHWANASYRLKRGLKCDGSDAEANTLLTPQYRTPYTVPDKV
jgi:hypothetical protein